MADGDRLLIMQITYIRRSNKFGNENYIMPRNLDTALVDRSRLSGRLAQLRHLCNSS